MDNSVRMIVRFRTKPNKLDDFRALMRDMREPTRAEAGCISYDLQESLDELGLFLFVEEWESDDDATKHLTTSHVQRIAPQLADILAAPPEVERYKAVW